MRSAELVFTEPRPMLRLGLKAALLAYERNIYEAYLLESQMDAAPPRRLAEADAFSVVNFFNFEY